MSSVIAAIGPGLGGLSALCLLLGAEAWARQDSSLARRLWTSFISWYRERTDYLIDRTPPALFVLRQIQISAAAALAVLIGTEWDVWFALCTLVGMTWVLMLTLERRVAQRRHALQQQIDPALQLIANAVQVTANLEEALQLVAEAMKPPMSQEMSRVIAMYRLGHSLEEALQTMAARCNDPFITALVIALVMGKRTGGNIAVTLRRIAHATREAVRVESELSSKTRGQQWQFRLIMGLFPLTLILLMKFVPQVWTPLTKTTAGQTTLLFTSLAWAGGAVWARLILNPKRL